MRRDYKEFIRSKKSGKSLNHNSRLFYVMCIFLALGILIWGRDFSQNHDGQVASVVAESETEVLSEGGQITVANSNGDFFSLERPRDIVNIVLGLPRQFLNILTDVSLDQMQFFLRDGFGFVSRNKEGSDSEGSDFVLLNEGFIRNVDRDADFPVVEVEVEADEVVAAARMTHLEGEPIVYIYNSHPNEMIGGTFADLSIGEMNIVDLSHIMAAHFANQGIPTLVEERNVVDVLRSNNWNFAQSYDASRQFLVDQMDTHDSLQFFFDLHRDGIARDLATLYTDDTSYARVLFVIGANNPAGSNPNYQMARRLHNMLEKRMPGISRGISVQNGGGMNGIYNQDIAPTIQLIEIGTVETTSEEALRTTAILSEVLAEYIHENKDK